METVQATGNSGIAGYDAVLQQAIPAVINTVSTDNFSLLKVMFDT